MGIMTAPSGGIFTSSLNGARFPSADIWPAGALPIAPPQVGRSSSSGHDPAHHRGQAHLSLLMPKMGVVGEDRTLASRPAVLPSPGHADCGMLMRPQGQKEIVGDMTAPNSMKLAAALILGLSIGVAQTQIGRPPLSPIPAPPPRPPVNSPGLPSVFVIGDSTASNGERNGWGDPFATTSTQPGSMRPTGPSPASAAAPSSPLDCGTGC